MDMRAAIDIVETGQKWLTFHMLSKGTILFHGTDDPDYEPHEIHGPAWFTTEKAVADHYARLNGEGRVNTYRLTRDLKLPLLATKSDIEAFCERCGIDRSSAEDIRDGAKRSGIPGWFIPNNYDPGDDILITDMTALEPVTEGAEAMGETKPVFEMPMLHTKAEDFQLGDPEINRLEYERLSRTLFDTLDETDRFILGHTQTSYGGEYFLLNINEKALVYYVDYEVHDVIGVGRCATQVVLWKRAGSGYPSVTKKVFFDYLAAKFDAVVSDDTQTADGRRFWIDRMAEAEVKGMTVGLIRGGDLDLFPKGGNFQAWLKQTDAWGNNETYKEMRYFISKKPLGDQ